jgi:hypothetical protein
MAHYNSNGQLVDRQPGSGPHPQHGARYRVEADSDHLEFEHESPGMAHQQLQQQQQYLMQQQQRQRQQQQQQQQQQHQQLHRQQQHLKQQQLYHEQQLNPSSPDPTLDPDYRTLFQ